MKKCPYCAESIQSEASKCRYCGEWLDGNMHARIVGHPQGIFGYYPWNYEYRSEAQILGWPLVHIAYGINPETGSPRIARGVIALGNIAIGGLALGGLAIGGITLGGFSLGFLALGGFSVGILAAAGGFALGGYIALGGLAISMAYAVGGLALAPHYIGGNGADAEFLQLLETLFPGFLNE